MTDSHTELPPDVAIAPLPKRFSRFVTAGGRFRLSWSWSAFLLGPWRFVLLGLNAKALVYSFAATQVAWLLVWTGVLTWGWWWVPLLHVWCGLVYRFDEFRLRVFSERVWGLPGYRVFAFSEAERLVNVEALRRVGWLRDSVAFAIEDRIRRDAKERRYRDAVMQALAVGVLRGDEVGEFLNESSRIPPQR